MIHTSLKVTNKFARSSKSNEFIRHVNRDICSLERLCVRTGAIAPSRTSLNAILLSRLRHAMATADAIVQTLGPFTKSRLATFKSKRPSRNPEKRQPAGFLLSHEELPTPWHPPTEVAQVERIRASEFTEL